MENQNRKIEFNWIKAHAGHHGNGTSRPNSERGSNQQWYQRVLHKDPKEYGKARIKRLHCNKVAKWMGHYNKRCNYQKFSPKIADMLNLKINVTPNFTTMVTGHGNIKAYLFKYTIKGSPICSCKRGEQTIDHILYECELVEQERDRIKAAVLRSENWPVSKDTLTNKYSKEF